MILGAFQNEYMAVLGLQNWKTRILSFFGILLGFWNFQSREVKNSIGSCMLWSESLQFVSTIKKRFHWAKNKIKIKNFHFPEFFTKLFTPPKPVLMPKKLIYTRFFTQKLKKIVSRWKNILFYFKHGYH